MEKIMEHEEEVMSPRLRYAKLENYPLNMVASGIDDSIREALSIMDAIAMDELQDAMNDFDLFMADGNNYGNRQ